MGKPKHKRKSSHAQLGDTPANSGNTQNNKSNKRRRFSNNSKKQPKLWIEDCKGRPPKKGNLIGCVSIVITRSDISDDFMKKTRKDMMIKAGIEAILEYAAREEVTQVSSLARSAEVSAGSNNAKEAISVKLLPQDAGCGLKVLKENNKSATKSASKDIEDTAEASNRESSDTTDKKSTIDKQPGFEEENKCNDAVVEESKAKSPVHNPVDENCTIIVGQNEEEVAQNSVDVTKERIEKNESNECEQLSAVSCSTPSASTIVGDDVSEEDVSFVPSNSSVAGESNTTASTVNLTEDQIDQLAKDSPFVLPARLTAKKVDLRSPYIRVVRKDAAADTNKLSPKRKNQPLLPNGDCGDGIVNPFPKNIVADKYWAQRHRLFTLFDEGIKLDRESWYSVTPEAIANYLAKRIVNDCNGFNDGQDYTNRRRLVVLDAFCGCGGNSIAFANTSNNVLVVAVDGDVEKLKMLAWNASIYKVPRENLLLIHADAVEVMRSYKNGRRIEKSPRQEENETTDSKDQIEEDCWKGFNMGGTELLPANINKVFLSPPWGGSDYIEKTENVCKDSSTAGGEIKSNSKGFHVKDDVIISSSVEGGSRINGEELLRIAAQASYRKGVIYFLPRNTNGISFGRAAINAGYSGSVEMEQNILNGKLKTITAYLGQGGERKQKS